MINVLLVLVTVLLPSTLEACAPSAGWDLYLNAILIACMTLLLFQWVYFVYTSKKTHLCVHAFDLVLILTVIFDLTWISDRTDIPEAVGLLKLLRLLHTVPACTKISRRLLGVSVFETNAGINGVVVVATAMMIMVYLVVTLTTPLGTDSSFLKGVVELRDINAIPTALKGLSQSKYRPLFIAVDGAVVFQGVDQPDFPSRSRLIEEYHSSNVTLFVDTSDVDADEALQSLLVSLTIISFMMLFAILAHALLYIKSGGIQTIEHTIYQLSPKSLVDQNFVTKTRGEERPLLLAIQSWSLDILSQDFPHAVTLVMRMFNDLSLIHPSDTSAEENFRRAQEQMSFVSSGVLYNFIMIAQTNYSTENAYHNFYHSIDVTHATFLIIKAIQEAAKLSPLEKFSLLIAALSHDMEHPGLNNAYLVKTNHPLATRYNDISVLENMHASRLFEIASSCCNANVFQDLDDSMKIEARRIIIHSIIHTDMSKHFPMVSRMELAPAAFESGDDRLFLAAIILHAADISNPARDAAVASKWAENILTEFFAQGDLEKSKGHDISPMCDRTQTCLYQTQKNFIDFIVLPFYRAMAKIFPDVDHVVDRILKTREFWADVSR